MSDEEKRTALKVLKDSKTIATKYKSILLKDGYIKLGLPVTVGRRLYEDGNKRYVLTQKGEDFLAGS